jgi:hypothetical protein
MKRLLAPLLLLASLNAKAEVAWEPLPPGAYSFGRYYPEAQHLLFAFDYGHALVYERLLSEKKPIQDPEKLERELLSRILEILKNPPTTKVDEGDIAPNYVFNFALSVNLFDWSHLLHQFIYDALVISTSEEEATTRINNLMQTYKANRTVAITDSCKTMLFMDGHYYSKAFRRNFPSFNLLIWSYHWLQIRLYEDLVKHKGPARDIAIAKTVRDFRALISDLPDSADFDMMPETFREAPTFSRKFPGIAASFDNNHMMHDIISDILVSDKVSNPRLEGLKIGRMALDPKAFFSANCGRD